LHKRSTLLILVKLNPKEATVDIAQKPKKSLAHSTGLDAQVAQIKVPPHSIEAEQSVLGGLMMDHRAWDKIANKLSEVDFYQADHRAIFRTISQLAHRDNVFDALTVAAAVKGQTRVAANGELSLYVYELANNTPSVANIVAYADIVRERSILRQLISISNSVADTAFNPQNRPSQEILAEAESKLYKIAQQGARNSEPRRISTFMAEATERLDALYKSGKPLLGTSSGFIDLDEQTSGLQKGDLIIVAGRPSMGKTAFAMNIAENIALAEKLPILVFSMEMPGESLAIRLISSLGRIDQHRLRSGKLENNDWSRITSTVAQLAEVSMFIDDTAALSPSEIRSRARRIAREQGGLGLIVVDYLQLMQVPGFKDNRSLEISEISRSLKTMAKELNVPVVALSQLNRGLEQRTEKRPLMSDLRESGAIEQDADLILFIYRDEVYDKNSRDKGKAEIIIAKQRNGPIGNLFLTFLGPFTRFENYSAAGSF
jgi:replicative DNA helicase